MSSTNQGSDDGAREDELDLGQEDADPATHTNGHVDHHDDTPIDKEEKDEEEEEEDQLIQNDAPLSVAASDEELRQQAGSVAEIVSHQGHPASSADDTTSIPDDTPSLHVG
jgi:hypothetical protein